MFNQNNRNKGCRHEWAEHGVIVIDNRFPRKVQICKKCGVCVHSPIYTFKSLAEKEQKEMS